MEGFLDRLLEIRAEGQDWEVDLRQCIIPIDLDIACPRTEKGDRLPHEPLVLNLSQHRPQLRVPNFIAQVYKEL